MPLISTESDNEELLIAAFLAAMSVSTYQDPRTVLVEFAVSWRKVYLEQAEKIANDIGLPIEALNLPIDARVSTSLRRFITQQEILLNRIQNPADRSLAFGLTERQWVALQNYRKTLQADFTSSRQINRMLEAKKRQLLRSRAKTVGISEATFARNAGAMDAIQEATIRGMISDVTSTWHTSKDERVRPSHGPMHGQIRPLRVPFTSGSGNSILFPGDPLAPPGEIVNCRCHVTFEYR